jgi:hypothetical protein
VLVSRSLRTPCRGHGRRRRGHLLASTHPEQASRPAVQGGPTNEEVERDSCERLCPEHVGARSSVRAHERLTGAGLAVARHTVVPDRTPEARRSSAAVHASASPRARVVSRLMAVERAGSRGTIRVPADAARRCGLKSPRRTVGSPSTVEMHSDAPDRPRRAPAGVADGRTGASRRRRPLLVAARRRRALRSRQREGVSTPRTSSSRTRSCSELTTAGAPSCRVPAVLRESPRLRSCGSAPR